MGEGFETTDGGRSGDAAAAAGGKTEGGVLVEDELGATKSNSGNLSEERPSSRAFFKMARFFIFA